MDDDRRQAGETTLPFDPAAQAAAGIVFIGHLATPWKPGHCPRNLAEARSRGGDFRVHVAEPYRQGLLGLAAGMPVIVLGWMEAARRDLIRLHPPHRPDPAGTFALRAPARPNPVSLSVVRLLAIDHAAGVLTIDASDAYDGTPVIDIKPWLPRVDIPPESPGPGDG